MSQMTTLEQNNLKTQSTLMKDIISNYGGITYSVSEKAREAMELLKKRKRDPNISKPDCILPCKLPRC